MARARAQREAGVLAADGLTHGRTDPQRPLDVAARANHAHRLRPRHLRFSFLTKASTSDPCVQSVDMPEHLADGICLGGATDGVVATAALVEPITLLTTLQLRVHNLDALNAYSDGFLSAATGAYLGALVSIASGAAASGA